MHFKTIFMYIQFYNLWKQANLHINEYIHCFGFTWRIKSGGCWDSSVGLIPGKYMVEGEKLLKSWLFDIAGHGASSIFLELMFLIL